MEPSLDWSLARSASVASRLRGAGLGCVVAAAGIAMAALIGWATSADVLERLLPGHPPMSVSAALLFVLASGALVGHSRSGLGSAGRRVARGCAAVLVAVGVVVGVGCAVGGGLSVDRLLVSGHWSATELGPLAANEGLGFVLLGAALLTWDARIGRWWPSDVLASLAGGLALLALQGYATGAPPLTGLGARQHIPVGSAAGVGLLSLGLLLARPERGVTARLTGSGQGALVLRRLLPVAIGLPVGLVAVTLIGQQLGLYGMADGEWMFAAAMTFAFGGLAWLIAAAAERTDAERPGLLRAQAERDPLTGLFNRRRFEEEIARELAASDRYGTPAALIMCDLDNLKLVNDTLGHQAGDELINGVAGAIGRRLRQTDVLARLGGDEFALLLPHADVTQARAVAESVRATVNDLAVVVGGRTLRTSVSVGISPLGGGIDAEQALSGADAAMYEAKHHGRNRVATSHDATHRAMSMQLGWLERLRAALSDDRFELHAQPITCLRTGEVRSLELLLRLPGEDGRLLMPATFIPIAERFGLIADIDKWVIRKGIGLAAQDRDTSMTYAINLSGASVSDRELLGLIEREILDTGADPGRLIFEFTETAAITDLSASRDFTAGLARIGCAAALDDFGAGFGSFSYLKHLPVTYIKIDGEFIRSLPGSSDDRVLVKAIVDVARGLRKQTIAEFVSSQETLELLRDYGVD